MSFPGPTNNTPHALSYPPSPHANPFPVYHVGHLLLWRSMHDVNKSVRNHCSTGIGYTSSSTGDTIRRNRYKFMQHGIVFSNITSQLCLSMSEPLFLPVRGQTKYKICQAVQRFFKKHCGGVTLNLNRIRAVMEKAMKKAYETETIQKSHREAASRTTGHSSRTRERYYDPTERYGITLHKLFE